MYENQQAFREEVVYDYEWVMNEYEPTNYAIETTLSKLAFYNELYGEDKEITKMAEKLFNKHCVR